MSVDPDAPRFPYRQVADRIRARIEAGEITARLPSQMDLAQEMGVASMTVQRALKTLKDEGLIYTVPGLGTFVSKS